MANDINIKEILKKVSVEGLFDVELTAEEKKFAEETNVTNPKSFFFIESLKGKFTGRDTQVNQETEVGTSQSVEEQAINACNGLKNDLKFEGTSNLKDVSTAKSSDISSEEQGRSR